MVEGKRWRVIHPNPSDNTSYYWRVNNVNPSDFFKDMPSRIRAAVSIMEPPDSDMRILTMNTKTQTSATGNTSLKGSSWKFLERLSWKFFHACFGPKWLAYTLASRLGACPISNTSAIVTTVKYPIVANKFLENYYHVMCNRGTCAEKCNVIMDNNIIYASRYLVIMQYVWMVSSGDTMDGVSYMVSFCAK